MFRSSDRRVGGDVLEDNLASFSGQQDDQMSDDDNAAPEMSSELDEGGEEMMDDPRILALEDLEGRVVNALEDVMQHSGVKSSGEISVQDELATFLRPVIEVAAHTAPSIARTYYQGGVSIAEGVEASCDEVYQQIVSDLVLPSLLDIAQTDIVPGKRSASLEFFRTLFKEFQKPGSWLDVNYMNSVNAGPYGSGNIGKRSSSSQRQPPAQLRRRQAKRLQREGEILRYWVRGSIACLTPGVFTAEASEMTVASRGVIAASASIRPSLKHIAQRIKDADDRGANKIFAPVMQMVELVLKKLFFSTSEVEQGDALRSSCIKFLEIVCLCCSEKPQDTSSRRKENTPDHFSLNDLPAGHPIITREALESIADYAFSTLRGLTMLGGQVKIDRNLLSDMLMGESTGLPTAPVISILKPAALVYLEMESNLPKGDAENALDIKIERQSLEFDFFLSQKSYALTVNAVAVLATNRPVFFKNGATCLSRRCADPPSFVGEGEGTHSSSNLSRSSVLAIRSHIKSSCLTLLRNALSVQTKSATILHKVLVEKCDMKIQADKALGMAETTVKLKTAGRAARNQAKIHYEWETSAADERTSKRKRETADALAKMRTAKVARGLGNGIQLPSNTVDAIELVIENIKNLPSKRPPDASKNIAKKKTPFTLDFLVDAIMTNGASLIQEEGRWYSRDGGTAWSTIPLENDYERTYKLNVKLPGGNKATEDETSKDGKSAKTDQRKIFKNQCQTAASEALGRITLNSLSSRDKGLSEFANSITARLAWMLKDVPPSENLKAAHDMALDSIQSYKSRIDENGKKEKLDDFAKSFPIVASCLSISSTSALPYGRGASAENMSSLSNAIINEAYVQDVCNGDQDQNDASKYDTSLDIFLGSIVHASERSNEKPADVDRKNRSTDATSSLQQELGILPRLGTSALKLVGAMCDLDQITKKAAEAASKNSQQTIAASAALHAAKQAAEKRANAALLVIRDACFQRSNPEDRKKAIKIAVQLAAGHLNASPSCEEKALKLVINMLYPRSQVIADCVVEAAIEELESVSKFAQDNYKTIQKANRDAKEKENEIYRQSTLAPDSEEEKEAMEKARKPVILFMALCIRRPDLIIKLFEYGSLEKADVLAKAVKQNMSKLARAAGKKHGSSDIALMVAEATTKSESSLLLSLLDTLAPVGEKNMVSDDFVEACYKIQEIKAEGGPKDPRYLIPVIFAIKRQDLVPKLAEFVVADSDVLMAALVKMAERLGRQALLFRDEPNPEEPSLKGMTHCEELVFLHKLDFEAAGVKQKEYLDAIKMCLDNEEVFNDQVVMSALDHMSGVFLTGTESLPLAFMRSCILVCSKHESLHSWICHTLLPRLVEGKIYEESRLWEGWMRCAKMLENHGDTGVSSKQAIDNLPPEQLAIYRERYGS